MGSLPGGSDTTIRHNTHKITHQAQTKHSTQSYTNNKGHIYTQRIQHTKKSKAIPVTGRGIL
jgi:hypothetical protein